MKKILKWIGGIFLVIIILGVIFGDDTTEPKKEEVKEVVKEVVKEEKVIKEVKKEEPVKEEIKEVKNYEKEIAYTTYVGDRVSRYSEQLTRMGTLLENATYTEEWTMNMVVTLLTMEELSKEYLNKTDIPEIMENVHQSYTQAMKEYSKAIGLIPEAIDNQDIAKMDKVTGYLLEGNKHIVDATNHMNVQAEEMKTGGN